MSKTALLCPGQGAQHVGMGHDFAEAFAEAAAVYRQADGLLGYALSRLCFEGPGDELNRTDRSQPAIFVTSVAIWRCMQATGHSDRIAPLVFAGLSLGEYTALHLAGSLSFEDGLRLVAQRGKLMQQAAEATSGGMVSVLGLDEPQVVEACAQAADGEVLVPANFNCPGQIVVSGCASACRRVVPIVEQMGGRAAPLKVAGAFHSPLMEPARAGLRKALSDVAWPRGRSAVVSNVSADYHAGSDPIRRLLEDQVVKPVLWQASIERLRADGVERFVEIGPGRVLTGLMRKIDRRAQVENYSTAAQLEQNVGAP